MLTGSQLIKKFPAFCGSRMFITAFKSARQLVPVLSQITQSILPHPHFLKICFNILSIYARVLQIVSFSRIPPWSTLCAYSCVCVCVCVRIYIYIYIYIYGSPGETENPTLRVMIGCSMTSLMPSSATSLLRFHSCTGKLGALLNVA